MFCFIRGLIEYCGIDSEVTISYITITEGLTKQISLNTTIYIPSVKSDMEQIVKFSVEKMIIKDKIIKTPVGKSSEDKIMTRYQYIVMGEFKAKVLYVAYNCSLSMNSFHVSIPFCKYLVLPKNFNQMYIISPTIILVDVASSLSKREVS